MKTAGGADDAERRGRLRRRQARLTSATNLAAKVVSVATSFATVPLTLHYLGDERFGLWMTIASLVSLLAFADLGLGNGLLNAVSDALGRDDHDTIRRLFGNALAMLLGVALAACVVLVPTVLCSHPEDFLNLKGAVARAELRPALLVFVGCFAFNIVGGLFQRAQLALQQGFLNALSNIAGTLIGLVAVLLVIRFEGGLHWLVAALLGGPIVATFATGAWFFARKYPALWPRRSDLDATVTRRLLSLGALFLLLQITSALSYASDSIIAARLATVDAVGLFNIASKPFNVVATLVSILLVPLWPAYAEAISRGDIGWVRQALLRSVLQVLALTLVGGIVIIVLFDWLSRLWLGHTIPVSIWLLVGLASWTVVGAVGNCVAIYLNGSHVVKEQVIIASVFALSCFGLKIWFTARDGITALPWVTTTSYLLTTLLPYALLLPAILRRQCEHASRLGVR